MEGNRMMGQLAEELDFDFKRNGSLVLCFAEEDRPALQKLYDKPCSSGQAGKPYCAFSSPRNSSHTLV